MGAWVGRHWEELVGRRSTWWEGPELLFSLEPHFPLSFLYEEDDEGKLAHRSSAGSLADSERGNREGSSAHQEPGSYPTSAIPSLTSCGSLPAPPA